MFTEQFIAGHQFDMRGRCSCGKSFAQFIAEREYWAVGAAGIAHTGNMTETELTQANAAYQAFCRAAGLDK